MAHIEAEHTKLPLFKALRLKEMRIQTIVSPAFTAVHKTRFIIWQNFEATQLMDEFVSFAPLQAVQSLASRSVVALLRVDLQIYKV